MARPRKEGMDYFPHDTDASNDKKIEALRALYGNDGYAFYFIMLEQIYKEENFELDISDAETREEMFQILAKKVSVTKDKFEQILATSLKWDCFNKKWYEEKGIISSEGIKKRASVVVDKREKMREKYQNEKDISDAETREESAQSKVKESKEKQINISLQIQNLRERYTKDQLYTIDQYFDILKWTRKNGVIAETVILKIYKEWENYKPEKVIYALDIYINNPKYHDKKENYCYGIMRNTTGEEIYKSKNKTITDEEFEEYLKNNFKG